MRFKPFILRRLGELPPEGCAKANGALLFMDISGFTRLSERLSKFGKSGTEELTKILNLYFGLMLNIIKDYRGEVLKFGGDALLIGFYQENPLKAVFGCGKKLMDQSVRFKVIDTLAGKAKVAMKIVIQSGEWSECILGDKRRSELFLSGRVVKRIAAVEDKAKSGEIWVNGSLSEDSIYPSGSKPKPAKSTQVLKGNFSHFLPQGVIEFAKSGIKGEHRPVTTIFLNIFGYDEDRPEIDTLQECFRKIIGITEKYNGSINKIDISKLGSKILITFGAPIAHEDATMYAVLAGMELREIDFRPLKIKIGASTGFVYSGIIGSNYAREYTVIGDAVNSAARLMAKARTGEIVVSESTKRLLKNKIKFEQTRKVKVKGKKSPLKRFVPIRKKIEKFYRFKFVGREKELSSVIRTIKKGSGFITIAGGPGIGKSRFLSEVAEHIETEYKIMRGTADELSGSFNLFTDMVANASGIYPDDPESMKREKLERHLKEIDSGKGELYHRLPFVGTMLFNISYSGSVYEQVDTRLRFENLCEAIRYYIEYQAKDKTVIIFDDVQWMGQQDVELIEYITRLLLVLSKSRKNIVFIFSGRHKPSVIDNLSAPGGINSLKIELRPLAKSSASLLSRQLLHNKPLPDDVRILIDKRAGGNPFYLEQFLLNLIEKKLIIEKQKRWVKSDSYCEEDFPENIWTAIMARVDRLETLAKECLRIGSVVGLRFTENVISRILGKNVRESLDLTVQAEITYRQIMKEIEYIFRHALIRDVIYDSILRGRRKKLHKFVGDTIEKIYKKDIGRFYGLLVHHFNNASDWRKALGYSIKAGDKAKNEYRNGEAIKFYKQAIEIIKANFPQKRKELSAIHEKLCDIHELMGNYEGALDACTSMVKSLPNDRLIQAKSNRLRSNIYRDQGRYDKAIRLLNRAFNAIKEYTDYTARIECVRVMILLCWLNRLKGELDRAENIGGQALRRLAECRSTEGEGLAKKLKSVRASVFNILGAVCHDRDEYERAIDFYEQYLTISEELVLCNINY